MDTINRVANPHLTLITQILNYISILPTEKTMEPEGEAEVEGGGMGTEGEMEIMGGQAPGGKDLGLTLARTAVTTEVEWTFIQEHIPWTDLMDSAGEETMRAGTGSSSAKIRTTWLKSRGGSVRSRGGGNTMKGALAMLL